MSFGDIASIATLLLFIAYIAGRIWRVYIILDSRFDILEIVEPTEQEEFQIKESERFVDLGGNFIIKLSSPMKIREVVFYTLEYESDDNGELIESPSLVDSFKNIESHESLYFGVELSETLPYHRVQIRYLDYSVATFSIAENRRNGSLGKENYYVIPHLLTYLYHFVI